MDVGRKVEVQIHLNAEEANKLWIYLQNPERSQPDPKFLSDLEGAIYLQLHPEDA